MTTETFFKKFELLANTPNAVGRMRELALELAIQGKLTEQLISDSKDHDWKILVDQLNNSSAEIMHEIDLPFSIPSSWVWTTLEKLGDTKPRNNAPDHIISSFIPMSLIPAEYGKRAQHEVRLWRDIKKGYTHFKDEDVVLAKITPCFENGKSTIVNRLTGGIGAGTTELHVFRRNCGVILPEFVIIFLKSQSFINRGITRMTGSAGQKRVPPDYFARSPFPLPPPAEQKRIVAKVDELMVLCNKLEEQQKVRETKHAALARASLSRFANAPTTGNLQFLFHKSYTITPSDLRKSILTLAVQGKLVHQDRNTENVELSIMRNDKNRKDTAQRDHRADTENQSILSGDDRWKIPDNWIWRGLADLVLFVDYRGKTPEKITSGIRLITAKNVRKGQINISPEEFISENAYKKWMTRGYPKAGDVLFTTEAPMGNAAVVERTERFALAQRIICFQSYGAIDSSFLILQILSDQFQFFLDKNGTGVTAKGIKAAKLKRLPVAVPPLEEQCRIVVKVNQLMTLVDQLEKQIETSHKTAANLLDAVVSELTQN